MPLRMRADRTSSDAVVDQALEVVEEYQGRILKIEQQVLLKPSVKTVRRREFPFTHISSRFPSASPSLCSAR